MNETDLEQQLKAALKTVEVLSRRIQRIEGGDDKSQFQRQLRAYQTRIADEQIKLLESQNWARLLVEHAIDAIIGIDSNSRITHWNPRAESMFGWKRSEVLGRPLSETVIPARMNLMHDMAVKRLSKGVEGRGSQPLEVFARRKDGSELPVEVSLSTLERETGNLFVAIIRDISERKRSEQALREANENLEQLVDMRTREVKQSEERFALAMRGANDGLWDWNLLTDEVYYSPRWKSMLGYAEHELGNDLDTWKGLVHPEDQERVLKRAEDYLQGRSDAFEVEMRLQHKNGQWLTILSRAFLRVDSDGRPERLVGTHVDITELKRTSQALAESEKTYHGIFDSLQEAVYVLTADGRFLDVNEGAVRMYGFPCDDFIGKTPEFLGAPGRNDMPSVFARIGKACSGEVQEFEFWGRDANGTVFPEEMRLYPGEYFGQKIVIAVSQDIRDKRQLEAQLRQSQKMESIGTLVGGIAHDFNNMLGAIQGNLYLARFEIGDPASVRGKLDEIEQLSARAAEMVRQLLTFARKDRIQLTPFALNKAITESLRLARTGIPENIELVSELCDEELVVTGDETQLQQVMMNLMNNARDALAGKETGHIVCRLQKLGASDTFRERRPELKFEDFALLSVSDDGCGIPADQHDRIFDPFFTTKEVGKGTGLGLAMVYGAVNSHGGHIEVDSEPGKGTTIHIALPLESEAAQIVSSPTSGFQRGNGETILLVDDEANLRKVTSEVLNNLGYRVLEAANGTEALEVFAGHRDDIRLMICDVVMPRMGGIQLANAILEQNPELSVIFVTGYDKDSAITSGERPVGSLVISKPFSYEKLSQTVYGMLGTL